MLYWFVIIACDASMGDGAWMGNQGIRMFLRNSNMQPLQREATPHFEMDSRINSHRSLTAATALTVAARIGNRRLPWTRNRPGVHHPAESRLGRSPRLDVTRSPPARAEVLCEAAHSESPSHVRPRRSVHRPSGTARLEFGIENVRAAARIGTLNSALSIQRPARGPEATRVGYSHAFPVSSSASRPAP